MARRHWPMLPRIEGLAPRQAHCDLPEGSYEREIGREGFYGPSSHLVHAHAPTAWTSWEGPTRPRAFHLAALTEMQTSPWDAPEILTNAACRIRMWRSEVAMDHLVRNGDGDELIFVHAGDGSLFCDFGHIEFTTGDYLVIPRGVQWRIEPRTPSMLLLIEASDDGYALPDPGIVGTHAPFDPALLQTPRIDAAFCKQRDAGAWRVVFKRRGQLSTVTFPHNPLDTLGWQGTLLPLRIHWKDIRPLMSHRYHLPPSAHTTFVCERFVVCTFVPRPLESDPGALKVPFFHSNNDYDEVIFYHQGDFFSRDNIKPGMLTLHPAGFPHGPHPKAYQTGARGAKTATDEVAVMIDTRDPLDVTADALHAEWPGYVDSWRSETTP